MKSTEQTRLVQHRIKQLQEDPINSRAREIEDITGASKPLLLFLRIEIPSKNACDNLEIPTIKGTLKVDAQYLQEGATELMVLEIFR